MRDILTRVSVGLSVIGLALLALSLIYYTVDRIIYLILNIFWGTFIESPGRLLEFWFPVLLFACGITYVLYVIGDYALTTINTMKRGY